MPLVSRNPQAPDRCTADGRWCVSLADADEGRTPMPVVRAGGPAAPAPGTVPPEQDDAEESYAPWTALVALPDGGFLAGVEYRSRTAYAGGGGSVAELQLFHVPRIGDADEKPVLAVPLDGHLMIRTCFGEKDRKRNRGACHAEFDFSARIGLSPGGTGGYPDLTYTTVATAFPRGSSRAGDTRPLTRRDLVRQRDSACSFVRTFRFDPATKAYRPTVPLPDCTEYTAL